MKKRILLFVSLIFSVGTIASAQTKTVTNADLEAFRQKRLAAERDYRENYAKLGFPSPQELEKQLEKDRRELEELSAQLRQERLERERIEALEEQNEILENQNSNAQYRTNTYAQYRNNYLYSYPGFGIYFYPQTRYRSRYNRRYRDNSLPPIRFRKPIRVPRFLQSAPNFQYRKR